ncbi:carboxymuconolactone decarboxylase family protein [Flavobacteriaceae bacterium]|jgi:AhpD family alkylhydroperoxidase|nr:carboxymuconolactone decarboxylase family protein [Flavobacteriaceae bacterium]
MSNPVTDFNEYRSRMNEELLSEASTTLKRIYNLDQSAYQKGELDVATKELLGLVASTVLRCDDCIKYHLEKCHEQKLSKKAVMEALEIATVVGGSIVIPHLRKAYEYWSHIELNAK